MRLGKPVFDPIRKDLRRRQSVTGEVESRLATQRIFRRSLSCFGGPAMRWLILGVTISISAGATARSQGAIANDVERSAVEFPPTRVLKPGEPFPPAELRIRRPSTPTAIELR